MTHDDAALWRAQLEDMPKEMIIAFLRSKGYEVSSRPFFRPDRVLAPTADADDEEIPFNALEDTRS